MGCVSFFFKFSVFRVWFLDGVWGLGLLGILGVFECVKCGSGGFWEMWGVFLGIGSLILERRCFCLVEFYINLLENFIVFSEVIWWRSVVCL